MKRNLRLLRPVHRVALAGAVALVLAALLAAVLTPRWSADAASARAEAQTLRSALAAAERQRRDARAAPHAGPSTWPAASRGDDRVADMLERALRHGVVVQRSQQRIEPVPDAPAQALRLQQTASGSYVDLRRLVADALSGDAALGLAGLRLQRSSAASATLDAELNWLLAQRAAGDAR